MTQPNEIEISAERGAVLYQRLLSLTRDTTRNFFEFGEILKEIRDNQLWINQGYDSFAAFFSDPELAYSKSSVYHSIALVENFPDWREWPTMPPVSKLIMLVPHLTDENKPKLLEYAHGLSRGDLKHELESVEVVNPTKTYVPLPKVYHCQDCGKLKGVFWEDLCTCGFTPEQLSRIKGIIEEARAI